MVQYGSLLGGFPLGTVPGTWYFFCTTSAEVPSELYRYQNVTFKLCWSLIGRRKSSLPASLNLWHELVLGNAPRAVPCSGKAPLERQSLSEVKLGRGSPICERVRKKIVEYFKKNVPQRQIAKALQISSSTVHNIIKRFRETGEISVRKGQGRRPLLDARGLRALRRHCITHQHDSVIDITKWALEYFQKPLSVNTIRRAICRCQLKLYHAKRKPYVNMVQKHRRVLWAKAHLKWTVSKWKVFYGQTSPNLTFLLEITDTVSSGLKRRETFQCVMSVQFKSQHLWWYGGA